MCKLINYNANSPKLGRRSKAIADATMGATIGGIKDSINRFNEIQNQNQVPSPMLWHWIVDQSKG